MDDNDCNNEHNDDKLLNKKEANCDQIFFSTRCVSFSLLVHVCNQ